MVVIHCKGKSEEHQFLYETTVAVPVSQLVKELVDIHNTRLRIQRLKVRHPARSSRGFGACVPRTRRPVGRAPRVLSRVVTHSRHPPPIRPPPPFLPPSSQVEGDDLATYGPARPTDKQGLDEDIQAQADGIELPPRGPTYCKDPTGKRDGNAPVPQVQTMLRKALDDAAAAASRKQVDAKRPLTKKDLMEAIDVVRGAVMIAYPMGLPEWDPVRMDIEADEKPSATPLGVEILDPATAQIWWAGKQMIPGNKLSDHVGRNEKTKIVAKLQKKGGGAPQREAAISPEEHKAMLAYYHKRQEEMKALEANDEDDYANSAWADSKSLKNHFSGVGGGRGVSLGGLGGRSGFNGGNF